ncbi:hypothetical protein PRIPAC_87690, partial [Pristionchus pacificus]|uniref:Uncharacterized protein n=1 Tax=Pristionchus pacificus TaxID=54126 RepID=A0A2A6CY57_PRIPA
MRQPRLPWVEEMPEEGTYENHRASLRCIRRGADLSHSGHIGIRLTDPDLIDSAQQFISIPMRMVDHSDDYNRISHFSDLEIVLIRFEQHGRTHSKKLVNTILEKIAAVLCPEFPRFLTFNKLSTVVVYIDSAHPSPLRIKSLRNIK